jgi:SAM-dependent methyltransferase
LGEQIPYDARVVEIGCGTGQLTNFLAIAHRTVVGVDVCLNSLRLAQAFKEKHALERATFAQMNLFRPGLKDAFFDVVISNGVLHHTADCRGAFQRVSRLLRPGGHLVVGLYSAYSRLLHQARRALFRWTGVHGGWIDPQFGRTDAAGKRQAWFRDQYCHPHETCHTLDEVLAWMDEGGIEFVNSIPKPEPGPALGEHEHLFEPRPRGGPLSRCLSQLASVSSGYREGGFFVVIGRKAGGPR